MAELSFIKLGGSLITDKRAEKHARLDVIARVAGEIAEVVCQAPGHWLVGHGSGSFGHVEARRHSVHEGIGPEEELAGLAATAHAAAQLHSYVMGALMDAGVHAFSFVPSSAMITTDGAPVSMEFEPLARALDLGLVPVVYGDVVLDRERGCSICSTETVFKAVAEALGAEGHSIRQIYWLGETEGVYGPEGETLATLDPATSDTVLEAIGAAGGTDVTGGMRHRLAAAFELAQMGVASWIGSGLEPGRLRRVVAGESVPGTWVRP